MTMLNSAKPTCQCLREWPVSFKRSENLNLNRLQMNQIYMQLSSVTNIPLFKSRLYKMGSCNLTQAPSISHNQLILKKKAPATFLKQIQSNNYTTRRFRNKSIRKFWRIKWKLINIEKLKNNKKDSNKTLNLNKILGLISIFRINKGEINLMIHLHNLRNLSTKRILMFRILLNRFHQGRHQVMRS